MSIFLRSKKLLRRERQLNIKYYGYKVSRSEMVRYPFHNDWRPCKVLGTDVPERNMGRGR